MKKKPKVVSLFSGAGGLDLGFERAGFDILFATDFNHECCESLKLNRGNTLSSKLIVEEHDITTMDFSVFPKDVDVIIGGPPCQSFSASGRRAGGAAGQLDKRGNLFKNYCKVVEYLQPKVFLFENVRGILATNKGKDFQNIVDSFAKLGYTIQYRILDAEDYGVPQQRERMFIVGHKMDHPFLYPKPLYGPDSENQRKYISVKEATQDLPFTLQDAEETKFEGGRYAYLLPLVPPGGNYLNFTAKRGYPNPVFAYRSRFSDFLYKANPDTPTKTLIASPGKYTGPLHWDNRYLTVSEYKRIQGFPDNHKLFGDRVAQIRQVGNSVCPKIAYYMALAIKEQVFGVKTDIEFLPEDYVLSFDKRKGEKAKKTKAMHKNIETKVSAKSVFNLIEFEDLVQPTNLSSANMKVSVSGDKVSIDLKCDSTRKVEAVLKLAVFTDILKKDKISITLSMKGAGDQDIQTMWNAVDVWVKRCSKYNSLLELYGHFTEPHPIFEVEKFDIHSQSPYFQFAKHCLDFKNCSVYFPKSHLVSMWNKKFKTANFIELAKKLRSIRYDIRCHETNIAIPQGVYMVAYPFALPYDKQMNFFVKDSDDKHYQKERIRTL